MENIKVSIILPSFKREMVLGLTLSSIESQVLEFPLEVIVVDDGGKDNTAKICAQHPKLDIKYIFSGQRNEVEEKKRIAGFALNIGVKQSTGDIILLSCAEIYHLNDCIKKSVEPLLRDNKAITTPRFMYFDDNGGYTDFVYRLVYCGKCCHYKENAVSVGWNTEKNIYGVRMPYLMGMWKREYVDIGGYDEDFTGYASDDNDFVERILANGCHYNYTDSEIVHLYHGATCDSFADYNNIDWCYNQALLEDRRGTIIRNKNREWGVV